MVANWKGRMANKEVVMFFHSIVSEGGRRIFSCKLVGKLDECWLIVLNGGGGPE